jgi:hypothetical protein
MAHGGGVSTWLQNTLKLASFSCRACNSASAVGGVVVSKPMAKNTTCLCGLSRAICKASLVEYTMRMSSPLARASYRLILFDAGTRRVSP